MRSIAARVGAVLSVMLYGIVVAAVPAFADTTISQGYTTTDTLKSGSIVSLSADRAYVEASTPSNADKMLGVTGSQSLVQLSGTQNQVQVAINGTANVLVSDINGKVNAGDKIAASPLKGVGMKALESGYVIGTAQLSSDNMQNTQQVTIKDNTGQSKTVKVGLIPVQVDVTYYQAPEKTKSVLPQFLLNLAHAIAGKDVSVIRITVALVILLTGAASIGVLLFASVRSSIISIGRNPLAAAAVNRSLLEVIFLAVGVLLVMLGAVYLVLVI